jgi:hypothetical protein
MSAEVTTIKKRGRPPKKVPTSSPADDNNVIVEIDAVATPLQQKTRGKSNGGSAAKKSPTLTTTSASTAAEKKLKGAVESASASNSTAAPTTKKRVVKSSSTAATTAASESKLASASTKTAKAEPVNEPEVAKVKARASSEKASSSVKAATSRTSSQVKKPRSTQESQPPLPPQESKGEQASEILQQARAFAKSPQEPNKKIQRLAQDREEETEAPFAANSAGSLDSNATGAEATPLGQQSGSEELETASSKQILDSPRYSNTITEISQIPEMAQAAASSASVPSKLLTTNPLFTTTRPKYTLPYSTTAALASRQQQQQEQSQSAQRPVTRLNTSMQAGPGRSRGRILPPPSEQPPGPKKPTQMQYAELKRDPKFRELSSRWTRILVALPIAIVTSYYVYQRRDEQRIYEQGLLMAGRITGGAETSVAASNADTTVAGGNSGGQSEQ